METNLQQWSVSWEQNVAAVLNEQESITAELYENLSLGDLRGAASSCFERALCSYQLGDTIEASSYVLMAATFMHADAQFDSEREQPESITLSLPPSMQEALEAGIPEDGQLSSTQKAAKAVVGVESLLVLGPESDPVEFNSAVRDAVIGTCNLARLGRDGSAYQKQLLVFAQEITTYLRINYDPKSTRLALDALNATWAAVIAIDDQTYSPLSRVVKGLKEIKNGSLSDEFGEECDKNITFIRSARRSKRYGSAARKTGSVMLDMMSTANGSNPAYRVIPSRASPLHQGTAAGQYSRVARQADL